MEIYNGVTNIIYTLQRNFQLIKDSTRLTNPKPVTIAESRDILPENVDKSLPTPTNLNKLLNLGNMERSMVTKQIIALFWTQGAHSLYSCCRYWKYSFNEEHHRNTSLPDSCCYY